jgi:membrane protease YdiL (CAAX protease family)
MQEVSKMKNNKFKDPLYVSFMIVLIILLVEFARHILLSDMDLSITQSLPKLFGIAFLMGCLYVLIVHFLLRYTKEKYRDIGFHKEEILKQIKMGALFGLLIFILQTFIMHPLIQGLWSAFFTAAPSKEMDVSTMFVSLWYLPVLLLMALLKGGLSEELWRVCVLTRFQKCFGKAGLVIALIFGSVAFGFGHLYQGMASVISISIIGFLYALVYLRKGLAWEAVAAHAVDDIIGVILGFILYYEK